MGTAKQGTTPVTVRPHSFSTAVACGIAIVCAAVVVGSARIAQAGINVWTSHGPAGTVGITALALDPTTPDTLYALTYDQQSGAGGVFKSTNAGGQFLQHLAAGGVLG